MKVLLSVCAITVCTNCLGDLDCNCIVDLNDADQLVANLGQAVPVDTDGDLDSDGDVSLADFAQLQLEFGSACY